MVLHIRFELVAERLQIVAAVHFIDRTPFLQQN